MEKNSWTLTIIEEAISESLECLETGEKLSPESIKKIAEDLVISIDCYL